MAIRRFKFTEVAAIGVATATTRIPANTLLRVNWHHQADWTAGGTAVLRVTLGSEVLVNNVDLKAAGAYTPVAVAAFEAITPNEAIVDAAATLTVTVTKAGAATGTAGRGELVVETSSVTEIAVPQVNA